MKIGDLVKTKCFGPSAKTVGEIGVLVRRFPRIIGTWEVFFSGTGQTHLIAQDGLELANESR